MRAAPQRLAVLLFLLFTSIGATSATADRQPILDALRSVRQPLAGTEGPLRGVPIQIRYQPNGWFQAVLNLAPGNPAATSPTRASR